MLSLFLRQDISSNMVGVFITGLNKKIDLRLQVYFLVRVTGLEPVRRATHAPQTCLSASSSTLAYNADYYIIYFPRCQQIF